MAEFSDFVAEVKERADIVSIINRYVPLKRAGARFVGRCPFHNDHSPSMHVTPQMGIFKCFVCGKGGDIFKFLQEYDKLSFIDALKTVADDLGMPLPAKFSDSGYREKKEKNALIMEANSLAAEYFQAELKKSPEVRKYLEVRGISEQVYSFYQVGVARNSWDGFLQYAGKKGIHREALVSAGLVVQKPSGKAYDRFVNRLMFPIWNLSNRIIAFGGRTLEKDGQPKYLNSHESPLYQKHRVLYGFNFARNAVTRSGELVLVEGYMDVLALKQIGMDNVTSVSGTALTEEQAEQMAKYSDKVYLFFDGDQAGQKAALRSLPFLLKNGLEVKIPLLPPEEDPDSYALRHGKEKTGELLGQSMNIVEFMLHGYIKNRRSLSPEEKSRLYNNSVSLLKNISSQLVRMEYLHQLHDIMDIPLKGFSYREFSAGPRKVMSPVQAVPQKKNLDWQVLQLIMSGRELYELALDYLKLDWIDDPLVKDLLERILAIFGCEGEFKPALVPDRLSGQQRSVIENMEILEFVDFYVAKRQFCDTITALEKRFIKKNMRQLNYDIRNRKIDRMEGYRRHIQLQNKLKELEKTNICFFPERKS